METMLLVFFVSLKKPKTGFKVKVWEAQVINQLKKDK